MRMITYKPLVKTLKEKDITLEDLAEKCGVVESVLRNKINGGEYIPLSNIDVMCSKLDVPVEKVIQWEPGNNTDAVKASVNWDKVNVILNSKGMTLRKLSVQCRLNETYMAVARKRNVKLKMIVIKYIAKVLDCKPEDIIAED